MRQSIQIPSLALIAAFLLPVASVHAQNPSASGAFFIENRGQWPAEVRLMASAPGLDAWVTDRGIVYDFHHPGPMQPAVSVRRAGGSVAATMTAPDVSQSGHIVRMSFTGSDGAAHGVEARRLSGRYNYLRGNDTTRWARNVPLYAEAAIDHLYDGIDARLLLEGGGMRYDLMVSAGADPSDVRIALDGALSVDVDTVKGELVIATTMGDVRQGGLFAYQDIEGARRRVACAFRKRSDGSIGFALGAYDRTRPLVIDPLVWSSYLPNAFYYFYGGRIELDHDGNPIAISSTKFPRYPTTPGAYDRSRHGTIGLDAVVTKLTADGSALIFSTFIGGEVGDNVGALVVDPEGAIYLGGWTVSDDYPTTPGAFKRTIDSIPADASFSDPDSNYRYLSIFATKLSADGSTLLYSTFIGPGYGSFGSGYTIGPDIAINSAGEAYLTGQTYGLFPTTPGAFQAEPDQYGALDAFVCKLGRNGDSLLFCTYLGGEAIDQGAGISLDAMGNILVIGTTYSAEFPTTPGALDRVIGNGGPGALADLFVVKLDPEARSMIFGTLIGGTFNDMIEGYAIDARGDIYISGGTYSSDFPITPNAYKRLFEVANTQETRVVGDAPFLLKLDRSGAFLHYATFIDVAALGLVALPSGEVWMSGGTNHPTPDAYSGVRRGESEGTLSMMNASGTRFLYSTFLGGSGYDWVESLVMHGDTLAGLAYTRSTDFPTTSGVAFPTATWPPLAPDYIGEYALFKLLPERDACSFPASAGADISVCGGAPLTLHGTVSAGTAPYRYVWLDESGLVVGVDPDLSVTPAVTTRYILIVHDEAGCVSVPDTVTVQVVPTPSGRLDGPDGICLGDEATFMISSITGSADSRFQLLVDYLPVTPVLEPATAPLPRAYTRTFTATGIYRFDLVFWDAITGCRDTVTRIVIVRPKPQPSISPGGEIRLCEGDSVVISASEGYDEYHWSNGATTRQIVVRTGGVYTVEVVDRRSGCSGRSNILRVDILQRPVMPTIGQRGDTLYSSPADSYQWYRDGALLAGETRQWIVPGHRGSYSVSVGNALGCSTLSREQLATPLRSVRLDTIRGRVGEQLMLTMKVDPPVVSGEDLHGFTARLRIDPSALFIHQGRSPDFPAASDPAVSREQSGAVVLVVRGSGSPALVDSILFQLDLEGLVTGQPLNTVVIESVVDDRGDPFAIAGDGLVILDGCAISRAFGRRARLIETRPNPAGGGALTVRWHAPVGAEARLRLVDAMGAEVWRGLLPVGTEVEQEREIPLVNAPSGIYMLQLIEGDETMALPVVVRR